ncbi:RadC family protein [Enorma phocaeensis]|uniref:RadC family protein n=1 Tax=Enorma phocaeensis TaxID=1871019 RepID=UPI00195E16CD|nr:DNA repair protein RadC [Enorma phocaeensis]MBM6953006.1 DNA repair protein RadC [Enorma phocaeensis]
MTTLMPREKLKKFGPAKLTDVELLRILIGSGNQQASAEQIARRLLRLLKVRGDAVTYQEVLSIPGMGPAKTCEIVALFELGRRYLIPSDRPVINCPNDAYEQLGFIKERKQECFVVLTLDGAHRLIDSSIVFQGTLDQSIVHPREIFAKAIEDRAASIILAHNHPSGSLEPSHEDALITEKLTEAGELMGISVLDHLIVAKHGYHSMKEG